MPMIHSRTPRPVESEKPTCPEASATATRNLMGELLVNGEEADTDVGVEVLRSFKPATITTQVNPSIGGQTVYEVA